MQTAKIGNIFTQFDICPATGHVGCNRNITDHLSVSSGVLPAGLFNDTRLTLMLLGIEDLVVSSIFLRQSIADRLALFDTHRTDKHRPTRRTHLANIIDDSVELFGYRLINQVVLVVANTRLVRRYYNDIQLVYIHKLVGFGIGGTGHPGNLPVKLKEVLQRNRRQRLGFFLDLDILFRLDRLVKPVRPLPAVH